jgi:hypothetical protein
MRKKMIWGAGFLIAAGLLAYGPLSAASGSGAREAVINLGDGYGVSECLTGGEACGALVATSWCRSNGYRRVVDYRRATAEDFAKAVGTILSDDAGGAVVISCGT